MAYYCSHCNKTIKPHEGLVPTQRDDGLTIYLCPNCTGFLKEIKE